LISPRTPEAPLDRRSVLVRTASQSMRGFFFFAQTEPCLGRTRLPVRGGQGAHTANRQEKPAQRKPLPAAAAAICSGRHKTA